MRTKERVEKASSEREIGHSGEVSRTGGCLTSLKARTNRPYKLHLQTLQKSRTAQNGKRIKPNLHDSARTSNNTVGCKWEGYSAS